MVCAAHANKSYHINKDPEVVNQERTEHARERQVVGTEYRERQLRGDEDGWNDPRRTKCSFFHIMDGWLLAMRQMRRTEPARNEGSLKRGRLVREMPGEL